MKTKYTFCPIRDHPIPDGDRMSRGQPSVLLADSRAPAARGLIKRDYLDSHDGNRGSPRDWIRPVARYDPEDRSRDGTIWPPGLISAFNRCSPSFHWHLSRWKSRLCEPDRERYALTFPENNQSGQYHS